MFLFIGSFCCLRIVLFLFVGSFCCLRVVLFLFIGSFTQELSQGLSALDVAILTNRTSLIRLLLCYGAKPESFIARMKISKHPELRMLIDERVLSGVLARGLVVKGPFFDFLAEGVCDAQILLHVGRFMYH